MTMTSGLKIFALVSDAHGGFGGISQYNRDALEAMCTYESVGEVHVLPRVVAEPIGTLPAKLRYHLGLTGGIGRYLFRSIFLTRRIGLPDLIYCAHINLFPVALILSKLSGAPLVLAVYGVDVWSPVRRTPKILLQRGVGALVSISAVTRDRMLAWCPLSAEKIFLVPNAIRIGDYGAFSKSNELLTRYGLHDKIVLMTLGRMSADERYKGFDEIIRLLPDLAVKIPNVAYLAVGDGTDRGRLQALAAELGVGSRVVFTGRIDDTVKSDIYCLADVFVMPSTGEGFGFVVLEALASGIPVVASARDGTREAVRDGQLGVLVEPDDPESIQQGILTALAMKRGIPLGLQYFSYDHFAERLRLALGSVCEI